MTDGDGSYTWEMADGGIDMDEEDSLVQVSHLVPESHRDLASKNTGHGGVSEAVRDTYKMLAFGTFDASSRLRQRLESVRRQRERVETHIEELEAEHESLTETEAELEDRLEVLRSRESDYEDQLDRIEEILDEGMHVFPSHGAVEEAARLSGKDPEEVIREVKDRNPDVPEHAFSPRDESTRVWSGR